MATPGDPREFHALVVDDDPISRRIVSFALTQAGFKCETATDGVQATDLLDKSTFDLLVTDLRMPHKHGHALVVDVLARNSPLKIVVHTTVDEPRLAKDLIVRGVDDVVCKPTNYEVFAAKAMGLVIRDRRKLEQQRCVDSTAESACRNDSGAADDEAPDSHSRIDFFQLKTELSDASKVLAVSQAALDVVHMVRSDSFDADQVAETVLRDPALAGSVLHLANSPFYNSTGKQITDIKQAVMRIGQKRVGEFALAMSAFASLLPATFPWMDLDVALRRCVAAGFALELLVARGGHEKISEGLLFSALMHSSGRFVLGTHYPKQYQALIKRCTENNESLRKHEAMAFPKSHPDVMCDVLADWNIPTEIYRPLKHVAKGYASLADLPEPMRTQVELVKLAILIGRIAVGSWESWDSVEFPSRLVLDHLRIDSLSTIIEQTEAQLPGITSFPTAPRPEPAKVRQPWQEYREVTYFNLSEERFDFLAAIAPSMGIKLKAADFEKHVLHGGLLVNRLGAGAKNATARLLAAANCDHIVFVHDADKMHDLGRLGTNIAVPCGYASLRSACWEVAVPS